MSDVDFIEKNDFHIKSRKSYAPSGNPVMVSLLLKMGIAKSDKQAFAILSALAVIFILITILIVRSDNSITNDTVTDQYGNVYTFEEYVDLVEQGRDPLLP